MLLTCAPASGRGRAVRKEEREEYPWFMLQNLAYFKKEDNYMREVGEERYS